MPASSSRKDKNGTNYYENGWPEEVIDMKCLTEYMRDQEESSDSHYYYSSCFITRRTDRHYQTNSHQQHWPAENDIVNIFREKTGISDHKE
jgi:hypothetical protein